MQKQTCKNGHTRTTENTYVTKLGYKVCRTCRSLSRKPVTKWDGLENPSELKAKWKRK